MWLPNKDDPPLLSVGTEVSAKYKGAFCEAKVHKVVKVVRIRVTFKFGQGGAVLSDENVKGVIKVGSQVKALHPDKNSFIDAVITKIQDCSTYTVVFDDGDITTLRRTSLCLKSGRHFAQSETLDQLPLTHPEHFGTPVVGGRKGRRSLQKTDSDESSDEEENDVHKRHRSRREEWEKDIGKVVCVEMGDDKRQKDNWFPGLVVAPTAQGTVKIETKKDYIVRSFQDGRYYTVPKKEASPFRREKGRKVAQGVLKIAVDKALQFINNDELPPNWDRDLLFGTNISDDSDQNDSDSESSGDEPVEEKDHFVAQLYKYMEECGTPINKGPTVGNRDLDLYKLFMVVQKFGGFNRVMNQNQWKIISNKMGLQNLGTPAPNLIKAAYKRYLQNFEDFYRKLGCTMVSNPRGSSRTRHRSGRSLIRDCDRTPYTNKKKDNIESSDSTEEEDKKENEEKSIKSGIKQEKKIKDEPKVVRNLRREMSQSPVNKPKIKEEPRSGRRTPYTNKKKDNIESSDSTDDDEDNEDEENIKMEIKNEKKIKEEPKFVRNLRREMSQSPVQESRIKKEKDSSDVIKSKDKSRDISKEMIKREKSREIIKREKSQDTSLIEKVSELSDKDKSKELVIKNKPRDSVSTRVKKQELSRTKEAELAKEPRTPRGKSKLSEATEGKTRSSAKKEESETEEDEDGDDEDEGDDDEDDVDVEKVDKSKSRTSKSAGVSQTTRSSRYREEEDDEDEDEDDDVDVEKVDKSKLTTSKSTTGVSQTTRSTRHKDESHEKEDASRKSNFTPTRGTKSKVSATPSSDGNDKKIVRSNSGLLRQDSSIRCKSSTPPPGENQDESGRGRGGASRGRGRGKRVEGDRDPRVGKSLIPHHVPVMVGDKLKVLYGPNAKESKVTYEAKVLEVEEEGNAPMYYVHYLGWNIRYDEWIRRPRIAANLTWDLNRAKKGRAATTKEIKEKMEKEKEMREDKSSASTSSSKGLMVGSKKGRQSSVVRERRCSDRSDTSGTSTTGTSMLTTNIRNTPKERDNSNTRQLPDSSFSSVEQRKSRRTGSVHQDTTESESESYESDGETCSEPSSNQQNEERQSNTNTSSTTSTPVTEPIEDPVSTHMNSSLTVENKTLNKEKETCVDEQNQNQQCGKDIDLNAIMSEMKGLDKPIKKEGDRITSNVKDPLSPKASTAPVILPQMLPTPEKKTLLEAPSAKKMMENMTTPAKKIIESPVSPGTPSPISGDSLAQANEKITLSAGELESPIKVESFKDDVYDFKEPEPFDISEIRTRKIGRKSGGTGTAGEDSEPDSPRSAKKKGRPKRECDSDVSESDSDYGPSPQKKVAIMSNVTQEYPEKKSPPHNVTMELNKDNAVPDSLIKSDTKNDLPTLSMDLLPQTKLPVKNELAVKPDPSVDDETNKTEMKISPENLVKLESPGTPRAIKMPGSPSRAVKPLESPLVPVKTPGSPSRAVKTPGSPSRAIKTPGSPTRAVKTPGSPTRAVKTPGSPTRAIKTPGSPTRAIKTPGSPTRAIKTPGSPTRVVKKPGSPSRAIKAPGSPSRAIKTPVSPPSSSKTPGSPPSTLKIPTSPPLVLKTPVSPPSVLKTELPKSPMPKFVKAEASKPVSSEVIQSETPSSLPLTDTAINEPVKSPTPSLSQSELEKPSIKVPQLENPQTMQAMKVSMRGKTIPLKIKAVSTVDRSSVSSSKAIVPIVSSYKQSVALSEKSGHNPGGAAANTSVKPSDPSDSQIRTASASTSFKPAHLLAQAVPPVQSRAMALAKPKSAFDFKTEKPSQSLKAEEKALEAKVIPFSQRQQHIFPHLLNRPTDLQDKKDVPQKINALPVLSPTNESLQEEAGSSQADSKVNLMKRELKTEVIVPKFVPNTKADQHKDIKPETPGKTFDRKQKRSTGKPKKPLSKEFVPDTSEDSDTDVKVPRTKVERIVKGSCTKEDENISSGKKFQRNIFEFDKKLGKRLGNESLKEEEADTDDSQKSVSEKSSAVKEEDEEENLGEHRAVRNKPRNSATARKMIEEAEEGGLGDLFCEETIPPGSPMPQDNIAQDTEESHTTDLKNEMPFASVPTGSSFSNRGSGVSHPGQQTTPQQSQGSSQKTETEGPQYNVQPKQIPQQQKLQLQMPHLKSNPASLPSTTNKPSGNSSSSQIAASVSSTNPASSGSTSFSKSSSSSQVCGVDKNSAKSHGMSSDGKLGSNSSSLKVGPAVAGPDAPLPVPAVEDLRCANPTAIDNTPPTTPESIISNISDSPRRDNEPGKLDDTSKSGRDSSEVEQGVLDHGKMQYLFSEDSNTMDSTTHDSSSIDASRGHSSMHSSNKRTSMGNIGTEGDGSETEEGGSSYVKPRKRRKGPRSRASNDPDNDDDDGSNSRKSSGSNFSSRRRRRHSSARSGNILMFTQEEGAASALSTLSLAASAHSNSQNRSRYNFCQKLDPDLDATKRITVLQNRIQELKRTYMQVKTELASVERRRKKLRRKEREKEANTDAS